MSEKTAPTPQAEIDALHTERRPEQSVAAAVTDLVCSIGDCDPADLPPLFETIDVDAVETLLEAGDDSITISFDYVGLRLTLSGDGTLKVGMPSTDAAAGSSLEVLVDDVEE